MLALKICGELKAMNEHNVLDLKEEIDKLINERLDKENSEKAVPNNTPSMVDHPRHYNREGAIECIDEMELVFGPEATAHFCLLNCWKYRYRSGLKDNGYQDLEKSDWYMARYKELKEKIKKQNATITSPYTIQPWQITPTWRETITNIPDGTPKVE